MAWEDRTPFEVIETEYGLDESKVIESYAQGVEAALLQCMA